MKSAHSEQTQRYLTLIKLDATNLFKRIKDRQDEFIEEFSLKRDREIFKEIFFNRYKKTTFYDLSFIPVEIIEVANDFYLEMDKLYWYLIHTQDMPTTIEDEVIRYLHQIQRKFSTLEDYINAELSGTPPLENIEFNADESEDEHFS